MPTYDPPRNQGSQLVPASNRSTALGVARDRRTVNSIDRLERSTLVQMVSIQSRTMVRTATVQSESIVATAKIQEMDRLAREAMSGQAMLRRWADTLAQNDPFLADELKFFTDTARLAKGEILADTMTTYCREGGRL